MIEMKKPHLLHKRFELPKGCSVKSFVMREIDGQDERDAGRWIAARGTNIDDPSVAIMEEQLRISIVGVNDQSVEQPYTGLDKWSTKTRRYLIQAWTLLNGIDDEDLADFIGAATDLAKNEQPEAAVLNEDQLAELKKEKKPKKSDAA